MALIVWKFPIETIHGALKRGVFGAAQRSTANAKGEQNNFSVFYGKRSTPYSADEIEAQERFSAIAKKAAARRNDATKKVADIAAFRAQSAIPTLNKYIWTKAEAEVDAATPAA